MIVSISKNIAIVPLKNTVVQISPNDDSGTFCCLAVNELTHDRHADQTYFCPKQVSKSVEYSYS